MSTDKGGSGHSFILSTTAAVVNDCISTRTCGGDDDWNPRLGLTNNLSIHFEVPNLRGLGGLGGECEVSATSLGLVAWELMRCLDSVVESTGARLFGVEESEVIERRRYVSHVRQEIEVCLERWCVSCSACFTGFVRGLMWCMLRTCVRRSRAGDVQDRHLCSLPQLALRTQVRSTKTARRNGLGRSKKCVVNTVSPAPRC